MRPSTAAFLNAARRCVVVAMTMFVCTGCKTETSPTFNGVTTDTLFTIEGGDVILDVKRITPASGATITDANPASLEFLLTCKFPNSGIRWGFYYLRDDGDARVFGGLGCLQTAFQGKQSFGQKGTNAYEFMRGHAVRLRLVVAANDDALSNGGPYIYLGTRDIVTWTFPP